MILLLVVAGQVVGNVVGNSGFVHGDLGWRDAILVAFALCASAFTWLQREAVLRFFRSMHTGVALVALSLVAVALGVLVPQIDGFEDPEERVPSVADVPAVVLDEYLASPGRTADQMRGRTPADHPALAALTNEQVARVKGYRRHLDTFKFAEAYFLYHLLHPYGIGMPEAGLPPQVEEGLVRFGQRYGKEEQGNREKQMRQAIGGQPKSAAITQFTVDHHDGLRAFFDLSTALHWNRAYKSNWFAALLFLLATGVALNTFRGPPRAWLTLRKAGWLTVHVGILVMLAGGFVSKLKTNRGVLQLDLNEAPQDVYWGYFDPQKPTRMPFHVKLDRFARKDWPTLQVGFHADQFTSRLPEYTLWPGREIGIDWVRDEATGKDRPNLSFRVKALAERAHVGTPRFWEAERRDDAEGLGPLLELSVAQGGDGASTRPVLLKPDSPNDLYADPAWTWRLRVVYGEGDEQIERQLVQEKPGYLGWLDIGILAQGHVEPRREPIALGDVLQVGDYTITVAEATADFRLDEQGKSEVRDSRPLAEQPPRNPGVWVTLKKRGGAETERRLVLQGLDAETHQALQGRYTYKEVGLKLAWDPWGIDGPPRYVLQFGPDAAPRLAGPDGKRTEIAVGAPIPLPGAERIALARLFHNARYEKTIEFLAPHVEGPHFDADFYATDPVGLELEIVQGPGTPGERRQTVRLASTDQGLSNLWQSVDGGFYVRFFENQAGFPFEWRSVLSIWQPDGQGELRQVDVGPEHDREIRVNDYFFHGGYRFFQTNADPERPTYSGIGVVYDPGIPIVLFGMYTIIVGTILAFLLRPIAEAYGKRRTETHA
ncbi:MAG: hypothetical protein IPJ77_12585 [Planctomycetes bacterium]|nr:hypothetical protein [Planctomycetota bacterium]